MAYANSTARRGKPSAEGRHWNGLMAVSTTIYKGSIVTWDASGYVTFATVGANLGFAGVALETKTSGAAEHPGIALGDGRFSFACSSATQASVGLIAYLDSGSSGTPQNVAFSDPGATALQVGRVVELVSATEVIVDTTGFALVKNCDAT